MKGPRGLFAVALVVLAGFILVRNGLPVRPGLEGTEVTAIDAGAPDPAEATAVETAATEVQAAPVKAEPPAPADEGRRILVSINRRRLWLVDGTDTLLTAPVAVGMGKDFTFNGRKYHFATPRGTRRVLAKVPDPVWIVPEWHYYEKAAKMGLPEVVKLRPNDAFLLSDSSLLEVRGDTVGRVNHFGNFAAFTPGTEIIFDDKLYIPPPTAVQRKVPNALGPYKLDTGDGYLIHGTHPYNEESIGEAVSHGCVRMSNDDLTRLYPMVPRGTPVIIF